jgi:hypothetical protein
MSEELMSYNMNDELNEAAGLYAAFYPQSHYQARKLAFVAGAAWKAKQLAKYHNTPAQLKDNPGPDRGKMPFSIHEAMTAAKYFESQAYFNKWLKEMTATEQVQITQMLGEFAALTLGYTLEDVLASDNIGSFEMSDGSRTLAIPINDVRSAFKEVL